MAIKPQLYFVIANRVGESTELQGQSVFSIQELEESRSLRIDQEPIKDSVTGRMIEQSTPLPALNYETSVSYVNPFAKEATITITHKTKTGIETKSFRLTRNKPSATFIDNNYIIKFGIDDLEAIVSNTTNEEVDGIIKRNVEKIKNLVGLHKVSILSTGNASDNEPNL